MGLGVLFIGYFFLINISYFAYTDIIAAMVMLLGLYKLSRFNRGFYSAMMFSAVFALISFAELMIAFLEMFGIRLLTAEYMSYMTIPRYLAIFALTVTILIGIRDLAAEVEAYSLCEKAKRSIPFCAVYLVFAIFEIPDLGDLIGKAAAYIYVFLLLAVVVFVCINLVTLYRAYATICMPEDLNKDVKESKFSFVNQFRKKEQQNNIEYADYKIKKGLKEEKEKANKKKK